MVAEDTQPNTELCPTGDSIQPEFIHWKFRQLPLRVINCLQEAMGFYCHLPAEHLIDRKIFNTWSNAISNNLKPVCPLYAEKFVCA